MFSEIKKLVKHSGIYALGVGLNAALAFLLTPIYTRFLSQSDFGRLEILQTFLKVLLFLIPLGVGSAILKCYHRDAPTAKEKIALMSTAFWFIFWVALAIIFILSFFATPLGWFLVGLNFPLLIYLLLAASFFTVLIELGLSFLRAQEKSKYYTLIFLFRFILTLILTIYLVGGLKFGLSGVILANLVAQGATFLFFLPKIRSYVKISYSKAALTKLLSFGLPILPASIAMWVMDLSDRYFLRFFSDLKEVAIYSLGYRVGFILEVFLVIPFQLAWPAFAFRLAKRKDHRQIYARILTYFFLLGIFSSLALSLFAPELVKILAPSSYEAAAGIVPLVSLAYVFYGLHFILVTGLHLAGKTKYYPLLIIFPALLNILLNFYFVPLYGMEGAALTTLVAFTFLCVLTYFEAQYFYPLKQEWRRLAKIAFWGLIIFLGASFLPPLPLVARMFLLLLFPLLLWFSHFLELEEKERIKIWLKRKPRSFLRGKH